MIACPTPGTVTRCAPGISVATCAEASGGVRRSSSPCSSSVGTAGYGAAGRARRLPGIGPAQAEVDLVRVGDLGVEREERRRPAAPAPGRAPRRSGRRAACRAATAAASPRTRSRSGRRRSRAAPTAARTARRPRAAAAAAPRRRGRAPRAPPSARRRAARGCSRRRRSGRRSRSGGPCRGGAARARRTRRRAAAPARSLAISAARSARRVGAEPAAAVGAERAQRRRHRAEAGEAERVALVRVDVGVEDHPLDPARIRARVGERELGAVGDAEQRQLLARPPPCGSPPCPRRCPASCRTRARAEPARAVLPGLRWSAAARRARAPGSAAARCAPCRAGRSRGP